MYVLILSKHSQTFTNNVDFFLYIYITNLILVSSGTFTNKTHTVIQRIIDSFVVMMR